MLISNQTFWDYKKYHDSWNPWKFFNCLLCPKFYKKTIINEICDYKYIFVLTVKVIIYIYINIMNITNLSQNDWPVKAANDHRLTAWTADGISELIFIIFTAVVEVLEAAAVAAIGDNPLITSRRHNGIAGERQGIRRARMGADLSLPTSVNQCMSTKK